MENSYLVAFFTIYLNTASGEIPGRHGTEICPKKKVKEVFLRDQGITELKGECKLSSLDG